MPDEGVVDSIDPRGRVRRSRRRTAEEVPAEDIISDAGQPVATQNDHAIQPEPAGQEESSEAALATTESGGTGLPDVQTTDSDVTAYVQPVSVEGPVVGDRGFGRDGGRGPSRRRGREGARPPFDGSPPGRRAGPPLSARPGELRGPNSASGSAGRPVRPPSTPYGSSLGRMPSPGDASAGFRSIGRSPEEIARRAQEARREARLNRGRMFRAAALGQTEPYRALGRGSASSTGANGNGGDRFGAGATRPPNRFGGPGRPPTGRQP